MEKRGTGVIRPDSSRNPVGFKQQKPRVLRYASECFSEISLVRAVNEWSFKLKRNLLTCRVHCNEDEVHRGLQVLTEDQTQQVSLRFQNGIEDQTCSQNVMHRLWDVT